MKLAKGAIHGDLFCDNVLFDGDRVAGIIDFGFAATDFFAYDLAITVNDWCVDADGAPLDPSLLAALAQRVRRGSPADADEREAWPSLLRAAALRFWLSRLYDLHLPRPGELTHAHDPAHFERILRDRVARWPLRRLSRPGRRLTRQRRHPARVRVHALSRQAGNRVAAHGVQHVLAAPRLPWVMLRARLLHRAAAHPRSSRIVGPCAMTS